MLALKKMKTLEIPLHPRSRRTKGPTVVTVEKLSEKVTERQATRDESVPVPEPAKVAFSGSLQSQRKCVNPKDIQSGSPVEMISSVGVPEQSLTIGLVGARLPAVRVSPTLVPSPSSSEKLDYSGDDID